MSFNQVSVGGRHIQYILEQVLRQTILREDKGHPLKQDEKKLYKLSDGIITSGTPYIEIKFYQDYILTVTDNIFTFAIHNRVSENHIMKALTDEQQETILIYLGFKRSNKKIETKCGSVIASEEPCVNEEHRFCECANCLDCGECTCDDEEQEFECDTCNCELDPNDLINGFHDQSVYQCADCFDADAEAEEADEDQDEDEDDDCYDEDMCDKCSKGLKMPNKYGSCECVCKCGELFWECRYKCEIVNLYKSV